MATTSSCISHNPVPESRADMKGYVCIPITADMNADQFDEALRAALIGKKRTSMEWVIVEDENTREKKFCVPVELKGRTCRRPSHRKSR